MARQEQKVAVAQYAFTRAVADYMLRNYDQVMMIDGEIGSKKKYDPRAWLKIAEESMSLRVGRACDDLMSTGRSISAK